MTVKKIISGVLALILTVSSAQMMVYADDYVFSETSVLEQYVGNDCKASVYSDAVDLTNNVKVMNYIKKHYHLDLNEKNRIYAFNKCYSGFDNSTQPPYFYISLDEESGKMFHCSDLSYPYEYCSVISDIIKQAGLSRYAYPQFYQKYRIKLIINRNYITQKQLLELASEIYDKTGQTGDYDPYKPELFEAGEEYIPEVFYSEKNYETESGMHIREIDNSLAYDGAVEITDQQTIDMYMDISKYSSTVNFIKHCPECEGNSVRLFSFDKVRFDNSKINGEYLNRSELYGQVYYSVCMRKCLNIFLNEDTDPEEIKDYLDKTYSLTDNYVNLSSEPYNSIKLYGFHYLTKELAEKIYIDLKEKGSLVSADFECYVNDKSAVPEKAEFVYPEKAENDIRKIASEMGLSVEIRKRTDNEKYIELDFTDVENTTQMDVVNFRKEIYQSTGLRGIKDDADYTPAYKGCLQFGFTNAVSSPDRVTYLDITLGQNTGFNAFITKLEYDHNNLELISASLKKDLAVDTDFTVSDDQILLINNKAKNITMSNQDVIRLGFRVKNDAADGKYEIKLSVPENQKTGVCCINNSASEWIKSEFTSGFITVDRNAVPKTEVSSLTLNRLYAIMDDNNSTSAVTGDINGDGLFNVIDVLRMKRYFTGADDKINNADVNEDGIINISDILILSDYILMPE